MAHKAAMVFILCFVCSGCVTFEYNRVKTEDKTLPKIQYQSVQTEKVWVPAETKKIWVNPYVDENGDMIDGHYKYVIIEDGHWGIKEVNPPKKETQDEPSKT